MGVAGSRVAVVGGSVAGCAAAIALRRAGCDVEVYERARGGLTDRGAGIILPLPLLDALAGAGYIGSGMRRETARVRAWLARDGAAPAGRAIWHQPFPGTANNWALVWRELRARVPDAAYHEGVTVRAVDPEPGGAVVEFDGVRERFDAVVGADGYRSAIRATVDPRPRPTYAGYVLWRGTCRAEDLPDPRALAMLDGMFLTAGFPGGHAIVYLIPHHIGPGRWVNWAVYTPAPAGLAFDDATSLPPGSVTKEAADFLFPLLDEALPPVLAATVRVTPAEEVYLQPIYDLEMPAYVCGRVLLIGDAGTLARPHTAAGAAKALQDALSLEQAATTCGTWPEALAQYDRQRCALGRDLVALGRRLGRLLVEETPDWDTVTEAEFAGLVLKAQDASAAYPYRRGA